MAKSDGRHHTTKKSPAARKAAKIKSGETEVTLTPKQEKNLKNALAEGVRRTVIRPVK